MILVYTREGNMGKVYQFPTNKKVAAKPSKYKPQNTLIKNAIELLVESYSNRIAELNEYIDQIKEVDGTYIKSPKQLMTTVRELNKMFYKYGLSMNCYKFTTSRNRYVIYFNDSDLIYVYQESKEQKAQHFAQGEFIRHFEQDKFTLILDKEIYEVFHKRIEELQITISTLKNTKV